MAAAERAISDAEAEVRRLVVELKLTASQRNQAQAVIGSIEDGVLVSDPFDELLLANDAASRFFGFDAAAAEHRPLDQIIPDAQLVSLIREMRESRSMSRRVIGHEMQVGDRQRAFRITLACLRGCSRWVVRACCSCRIC